MYRRHLGPGTVRQGKDGNFREPSVEAYDGRLFIHLNQENLYHICMF